MNIKKIVSSMLTAAVLTTTIVMPSYAEDSFSTAKEFLSDVLDVSTAEVESQTLITAKETVLNSISVSGDEVFYDGVSIGYWYSDDPSKLYADNGKTSTVIAPDTEGYTVSPSILYDMLYDLNELLEDNYVPSTADWSKIIGKYDVTLGGVTIPADQWLKSSSYYDYTNTDEEADHYYDMDVVSNVIQWNATDLTGIRSDTNLGEAYTDNTLWAMAWLIDESGELYLQNGLLQVYKGFWGSSRFGSYYISGLADNVTGGNESYKTAPECSPTSRPYLHLGLANTAGAADSVCAADTTNTRLCAIGYATDLAVTTATAATGICGINNGEDSTTLLKLSNPAVINDCVIDDAKAYGIVYFTGDQAGTVSSIHAFHTAMFDSYSSSKSVKGNQKLAHRLSALASLLPTDTVTVKSTGWTVNGHDNSIDNYITDQSLNNAGDTADIAAVADIDALKFHVVVPTSLPIYIDDANITYVADNADVVNKSGAAVKITDVEIVPKQDSGWAMVDGTPSTELEGHEFNFTTTIEKDKVLAVSEVYPFQYSAKLSPTAEASNSLELASVLVTVDWAST